MSISFDSPMNEEAWWNQFVARYGCHGGLWVSVIDPAIFAEEVAKFLGWKE